MRIRKFIDIQQEIEIDLSAEDIMLVLDRDGDSERHMLRCLNEVACFLNAISDKQIKSMNASQKKAIHEFLFSQSMRYAPKIDSL